MFFLSLSLVVGMYSSLALPIAVSQSSISKRFLSKVKANLLQVCYSANSLGLCLEIVAHLWQSWLILWHFHCCIELQRAWTFRSVTRHPKVRASTRRTSEASTEDIARHESHIMSWILASFRDKSQGINTHDFFSKHLRSLCPITATCSSHQHPALSTHGGAVPGGKRDLVVVTHEQFRVWIFRMFLYVFLFAEKEAWIEFRILCHTQCCTDSVVAL